MHGEYVAYEFGTKSAEGSRFNAAAQSIEKAVGAREAGTFRKEDVRLASSIDQLVCS
jgi:hypothetical protein